MKFLITGGSGFVGKKFSEELIKKYGSAENEFIFIARKTGLDFLNNYKDAKIKIVSGDISDYDSIKDSFVGVDYVFHLAAKIDYGDFNTDAYYKINVEGTKNIFELSLINKVKKVLYLSTSGIHHPTYEEFVHQDTSLKEGHTTRYTHSKYLAHLVAQDYLRKEVPIISIFPSSIFGENSPLFSTFVKTIKISPVIILPKDSARLSLLYVDDLVNGMVKAFEKGEVGGKYYFSGPDLTLKQMAQKIAKIIGKRLLIIEVSLGAFKILLKFFDFISRLFKIKIYYNSEFFNFVGGGLLVDHRRTKEKLNFQETDFDENFSKMVKSFL